MEQAVVVTLPMPSSENESLRFPFLVKTPSTLGKKLGTGACVSCNIGTSMSILLCDQDVMTEHERIMQSHGVLTVVARPILTFILPAPKGVSGCRLCKITRKLFHFIFYTVRSNRWTRFFGDVSIAVFLREQFKPSSFLFIDVAE